MRFGIGARLVGGFLAVAVLIAVILLTALSGLRQVERHYRAAVEAYSQRALIGLELKGTVLDQVRAQKNYLLRGEPAYLAAVEEQGRGILEIRTKLGSIPLDAGDEVLLVRIEESLDELDAAFRLAVEAHETGGAEAADAILRGKAAAAVEEIDDLIASSRERAEFQQLLAKRGAERTRAFTSAAIAIIGLVAVALGLGLTLSVTRPLHRLQSQMQRLTAGGPPPSRPAVSGRDEIAQIADAFYELVQRAALLREMEARSKRLEALSTRSASTQEEERGRIARELHDELGQLLTAIKLELGTAEAKLGGDRASAKEHIDKARSLIDEGLGDVRRIVFQLRPPALDNLGLVAALNAYAREVAEHSGTPVRVEASEAERRLPPDVETALYRICQEALTNAVRHAGARQVVVTVTEDRERVTLTVADDGVGFDVGSTRSGEDALRGVGLLSMERRAAEQGGTFRIESQPGQGTTVEVSVPRHHEQEL